MQESAARALGQNHDVNAMQRQLQRLVEAAAEEAEGWARKLKSLGDDEKAMQVRAIRHLLSPGSTYLSPHACLSFGSVAEPSRPGRSDPDPHPPHRPRSTRRRQNLTAIKRGWLPYRASDPHIWTSLRSARPEPHPARAVHVAEA